MGFGLGFGLVWFGLVWGLGLSDPVWVWVWFGLGGGGLGCVVLGGGGGGWMEWGLSTDLVLNAGNVLAMCGEDCQNFVVDLFGVFLIPSILTVAL